MKDIKFFTDYVQDLASQLPSFMDLWGLEEEKRERKKEKESAWCAQLQGSTQRRGTEVSTGEGQKAELDPTLHPGHAFCPWLP